MLEIVDTGNTKEDKEENSKDGNIILSSKTQGSSEFGTDVTINKIDFNKKLNIPIQVSIREVYKELKSKKKFILKESLGFILFYISYFLYVLSLEACLKGEESCAMRIKWQIKKVVQEFISCLFSVLSFELIYYKIISKFHLIHFFVVFSLFYIYTHGIDFYDHGYYNFIYFFVIVILLILLLIPFNLIIYIIQRRKQKKYLYLFIMFLIIIGNLIYLIVFVYGSNCNDWGKGLNNTSIKNNISIYGCQIQFPKKCTYKPIYFFQDYTRLLRKKCTTYIKQKSKDNLLRNTISSFIDRKTNRFGYPLTNKDPICIKDSEPDTLEKNFVSNLVDMDNNEFLELYFKNKTPEVIVDFTNNVQGSIDINISYDETLSIKRKLLEKNIKPYSKNILIVYIDSVSRQNAIRELKKTLKFFENFMSYKGGSNENYPEEIFHSFEFFKYHTFIGHTSINFPFLFYGQDRTVKNKILINKYFKDNGFITSLANDMCLRDSARSDHEYMEEEVYDHEFILCDPNKEHVNINTVRCLYGRPDFAHLLDYTEQFWRKYSNNRKYSLVISNYGHEGTLQVLKYIDSIIFKFLNNLFSDNLLKDTTVFLMSDHGAHMPSINYLSDFYQIEKQLPMLYIMVNDREKKGYEDQYKYIYENQQNLITAFDFYNTLCNIIFGDKYVDIKNKTLEKDTCKSPYGVSLFHKINSNERHPNKFKEIRDMELFVCK